VPQSYQLTGSKQFETNAGALFSALENKNYEDGTTLITNFCIENNAVAMLGNEKNSVTFGDFDNIGDDLSTAQTYTTDVTFSEDKASYTLSVISLSKTASELFSLLLRFIPLVLTVILLLSALSALICSRVIVAPIAKISQISKRMTELDMTWRCDTDRKDEIGVLSSSLNTMAARLQSTMEELETANQQLTKDVKKFKMLEEQHRNFFAAVSHELKTPLTILKGQLENMILGFGDYQNHDKYLPQVLKSAEDIEYLVKEILSITKMETMNIGSSLETLSLADMISKVVTELQPLAAEKDIAILQNIPEDISVSVNRNLFAKALSNIIGNAIRHSKDGAKVYADFDRDTHILVVENTGVFLDEDNLENMFTPFYRADKSRSKATGGSGLGLYIVKTILDLHQMGYQIMNTDKGVAFYLKLN
jgi:two-component system sensor histidine kinase VanS